MDLQQNIWFLLPELLLSLTVVSIVVTELLLPEEKKHQTGWLAATAFLGCFIVSLVQATQHVSTTLFHSMVVLDPWTSFFRLFFEATGFIVVLTSLSSVEVRRNHQGEYYAIVVSVVMGLMFMASATDLVMILLAMETVGLLSYILVAYDKESALSSEAGLKYLIYGATTTGVMLFGFTYLYGLTGTTNLHQIALMLARGGSGMTLDIVMLFTLAGFGFKIAMVPFHMWCPDVYHGAPTPVTGFLSVGPKAAGFALLIRFLFTLFSSTTVTGEYTAAGSFPWTALIAIVSAFTMTIGNLSALTQQNVKRMLAYSSIAHAGYMLMGLVVANSVGLQAILFYLVAYLFMNLGAFLVVTAIRDAIGSENIEDFRGIGKRMAFVPVMFCIFLFSLTGIPPFSGFIGKFYLFFAVIDQGMYWLVTIAIINTVISLYYYARVAKAMFLEDSEAQSPITVSPLVVVGSVLTAFPTLILGIYWRPIIDFAENSAHLLLS